jgi:hypothetical protein
VQIGGLFSDPLYPREAYIGVSCRIDLHADGLRLAGLSPLISTNCLKVERNLDPREGVAEGFAAYAPARRRSSMTDMRPAGSGKISGNSSVPHLTYPRATLQLATSAPVAGGPCKTYIFSGIVFGFIRIFQ